MRTILLPLLFILFFLLSFNIVPGVDTYWQLKTGEVIVKEGLPFYDVFSYTAQGERWVVHEWLSNALFYLIYTVNPNLLLIFKGLIIALAFFLLTLVVLEEVALAPVLGVILSATCARVFFDVRPQIFTYFFLALLLLLLKKNWIHYLPFVFLLWCNLHSGFMLGLLVFFLYVGEKLWREETREEGKRWLFFFLLSFLLTFANPNSYMLHYHFISLLTWRAVHDVITEWQSPDFHRLNIMPFEIMLLILLISFVFAPRRKATDILLSLILLHFALQSVRHIPLFAILCAPIIVENLREVSEKLEERMAQFTRPMVLLFPFILCLPEAYSLPPFNWMFEVFVQNVDHFFPLRNIEKLKKEEGNLFNDYAWGGYIIFNCYPQKKVFVDGRAEVYRRKHILRDYFAIMGADPGWEELVKKYDISLFLITKNSTLAKVLREKKDYQLIAEDAVSYLFKRR